MKKVYSDASQPALLQEVGGSAYLFQSPIERQEAYDKWEVATKALKLITDAGHITEAQLEMAIGLAQKLK